MNFSRGEKFMAPRDGAIFFLALREKFSVVSLKNRYVMVKT